MRKYQKLLSVLLATVLVTGCGTSGNATTDTENSGKTETTVTESTNLAMIDNTKWQYEEADNVYWQVGISYCENPADASYETLGIYVPGEYMDATENGDGTYTCTINTEAEVAGYTAATAPIVIPVNTPGYSAMAAPTGYSSSISQYTQAGFVYVSAGCRGRDAGAPSGVTDLKAAVRYIRYSEEMIPGDTDSIFTFGMSGGGAQSAIMGATGDSDLYTEYLEAIGAVMGESDAIAGAMCWCPITNLDTANEAYEWNMGVTRSGLDEEMQALSDGLAEAYASYINELGLTDSEGQVLTLTTSEEGIYQAGTYYDYLKSVIEDSLNNFLSDTTFPYSTASSGMGGMMGGMMGGRPDGDKAMGELPSGELPSGDLPEGMTGGNFPSGDLPSGDMATGDLPSGDLPSGDMTMGDLPSGDFPSGDMAMGDLPNSDLPEGMTGGTMPDGQGLSIEDIDGIQRNETAGGVDTSGTYETAQDYIDALNANGEWIIYDSATNTATITSIADFVSACKTATKSVGAFDDLDEAQGENVLFGYGDGEGAHFDATMAELLANVAEYGDAYAEDLAKTDALGNTVDTRIDMYNPMYYLCEYYDGYQTSNVATYWRIRTGIEQSDTALCTEVNLALALESYGDTEVDFETVWGEGHSEAERTGNSTENFIAWVNECLQSK